MSQMFVLFEHAAGYALFRVREFEEIGMLLPQVEASVSDLSRFNGVVKLVSFFPFKAASTALANVCAISEGTVPDDLRLFLETHMPTGGKKNKVILGVGEPKLASALSETLGVTCQHVGVVPEIIRGIRHHLPKLIQGFTAQSLNVAQLGLAHSYSRTKVKYNVHRSDNMIIQSIALLDQLDKDINTFSMRIREWYSYHFPELVKIVPENYMYAKVVLFIKNRKELTDESLEQLEEIVMDSGKAQAVLSASRSSMGMDISPVDLINIGNFASRVVDLSNYRRELSTYLRTKMEYVAPNLARLLGDQVGARLISHAGSLTNLAKFPASTVQILGAEKALFRALKTRGNTPKYGLLFHSTFIGRAGPKNKGRISRYLANKSSIASRIDCFTDEPNHIFGEKLRQQVEDRLTFYETGDLPAKNIDVMKEAMEEVAKEQAESAKKKKKSKKRKSQVNEEVVDGIEENGLPEDQVPKKKKKKRKSGTTEELLENGNQSLDMSVENDMSEESTKKKKKKKKSLSLEEDD